MIAHRIFEISLQNSEKLLFFLRVGCTFNASSTYFKEILEHEFVNMLVSNSTSQAEHSPIFF